MYTTRLILLITPLFFIISCGNPELDKSLEDLNKVIADKNHGEILKYSDKVLAIDPENLTAIAAFRDSAKVYIHIKEASELLLQLDEKSASTTSLPFTSSTPLSDPTLISYLQNFYNKEASKSITVDGAMGPSTKDAIKWLNIKHGLQKESEATDQPSSTLITNILSLERANLIPDLLEIFNSQINLLTEAQKSLKKAARLDPRFKGVIDLEEHINDRAEIFSFFLHSFFLIDYFTTAAIEHAGYYDGVIGLMRVKLDTWRALDIYSLGPSDAYSSSVASADEIYSMLRTTSKIDIRSARKLLSIYKDLEDDFNDLDSIEPAIELTEAIIEVMKLAMDAKGSMNDWSNAMTEAVDDYAALSQDLANEIDPIDELLNEADLINESLEEYLDEDIIKALDNNITYI